MKTIMAAHGDQKKVAIYVRVSTKYQIDKESLPFQRNELPRYAEVVLGVRDYEIFEDAGYSAKNTDRPAYQQMMSRVRAGEFSHILVWKIDRISRNLLDFAQMWDELQRCGVTFVSKNEQFDTSTAIGEAMLQIVLVFAQLERKMTSERVSAIFMSRAEEGQWNGGKTPFGYRRDKEKKKFLVEPSEAKVVRMIYDLYKSEHSTLKVAKTLNERGLHQRSGKAWTPTTVSIILKNPFYTGKMRYNYRDETKGLNRWSVKDKSEWVVIDNHHKAIVTEEEQEEIGRQLVANRRNAAGPNRSYTRIHTHIFAGLLTCGHCGRNMSATLDRARADGWRPSIYNCVTRRRDNSCQNKYISDTTLGPFTMNFIANLIKASNSFGKTTSVEVFQKKILRGPVFKDVIGIEAPGLYALYSLVKRGKGFMLSKPDSDDDEDVDNSSGIVEERTLLMSERRRKERALKRLTSAYLYDESTITESEFIAQRKEISDALAATNARIAELDKAIANTFNMSDDDLMKRATFFIMQEQLLSRRFVNYSEFIQLADPKIVRNFVTSVIQNFCILDGKIQSITFKNGLELKFLYRQND